MLGFDREQVRLLAGALRTVRGQLTVLRCDDPMATEVRSLLRLVLDTLDPWTATLQDLGANRVLEHRDRVLDHVDGLASLDAFLLAHGAGWVVLDDGTAHLQLAADERAVLAAQLGCTELVTALTALEDERTTALQAAQLDGADPLAATQEIDAAITSLVTGAVGSLDEPDARGVLATIPVESAAVAFPTLSGTATARAQAAVDVLSRWLSRPMGAADSTSWPLDAAGPHVLEALADSAATSMAFLRAVLAHPLGFHLVTATSLDPHLATSVVLTATDPAHCSIAAAGEIVRPYVAHVLDADPYPEQMHDTRYRDLLGAVVGPWLLQMTSRAVDWGWTEADAVDELARVLHDSDALAALVAAGDSFLSGMSTLLDLADPAESMVRLHEISSMMGTLDAIVHEEMVADELADRVVWDMCWQAVGQVTSAAVRSTGVGGATGRGVNDAVQLSIGRLQAAAEQNGWMGAPRPVHTVVSGAQQHHDWRRTVLAASTATAVFDTLVALEAVPVDTPRPPAAPTGPEPEGECTSKRWRTEFNAWMTAVDTDTGLAVDRAVTAMLNGYGSSQECRAISR